MINYLEEMKEKEKYLRPLTKRMDDDIALINVTDRVLRDAAESPRKIPNSLYAPLNDLQILVTTVKAYLGDAEEQVIVSSEDENLDTADIEAFIKAFWREVDNRWRKGLGTGGRQITFPSFTFEQIVERGRVIAPCLCRIEDGQLIADVRYADSRYACYESGEWAGRLMTRTPKQVLREYPDLKDKIDEKQASIEVRNILTLEDEIVYVGENEVWREKHGYKELPAIQQIVPMGASRADADSLKYEGESILLMIRDIAPLLMEYASIIRSLNMKELDHALQELVKPEDRGQQVPKHDDVTNPLSVTQTTGGFSPVPIGELKAMAERYHNMLEVRGQRAGLTNFDMGTFNQQMSGIALIRVGQNRDRVLSPRFNTQGLLKKELTTMAIEQIREGAKKAHVRQIKLGRQTYALDVLEGEYDIDFKYKMTDTTVDAARQALAVSQKGSRPLKSILRDTLLLDDPDGEIRELRLEEAEVLFPNIKRKRIIMAAAEAAEKGDEDAALERDMMLAELGITLDQLFTGQLSPTPPPGPTKPQPPMIPLFDERATLPKQEVTPDA